MARAAEQVGRVEPGTRTGWRASLVANHGRHDPIWLAEGGAGDRGAAVAAEEAVCFGWMDSLLRKLDERRWMLLVSPRRPGCPWSRVNKERVARLRAAGLTTPASEARRSSALADRSWTGTSRPNPWRSYRS